MREDTMADPQNQEKMPNRESYIWQLVKELEEGNEHKEDELQRIRATMYVNFGPEGRVKQIIKGDINTFQAVFMVLEHYIKGSEQ